MTGLEKKRQLEQILIDKVLPLIDRDYVLYGLPYYNNVGDTLIWNGEIELLKRSPYKCRGVCSWCNYPKTVLPDDVMILVTGGGYFGDLWRRGWQEVLDGIRPNRNHRIIIMPCSIFYEDAATRTADAEYLSGFPNLTILARDKASYDYARKYFRNEVMMVPDMAFCMNEKYLAEKAAKQPERGCLYFCRGDKERSKDSIVIPESDYDTHDWAPMESLLPGERRFNSMMVQANRLWRISRALRDRAVHYLYRRVYRRVMTDSGAEQLASYNKIYSTRLHAMILAVMLDRQVYFIDNSYGKIKSYYDTWLSDCSVVKPLTD